MAEEEYPMIKYLWQNLFVENVSGMPLEFDAVNSKETLLPHVYELPIVPPSILELGAFYNPWSRTIAQRRDCRRIHLSDSAYETRGKPDPAKLGLASDVVSSDIHGLPGLLSLLPELNLGNVMIILPNVVNYVDGGDLIQLFIAIEDVYLPQIIVVGNNFNAILGFGHTSRIKSPTILRDEILLPKGFLPVWEEYDENQIVGIYQKT